LLDRVALAASNGVVSVERRTNILQVATLHASKFLNNWNGFRAGKGGKVWAKVVEYSCMVAGNRMVRDDGILSLVEVTFGILDDKL
jgi:hypothetical protein